MAAAVTPVFPYRMLHLLNLKVQQQQLQKRLLVVLALLIPRRKKCRRQRRRWWVKPWIISSNDSIRTVRKVIPDTSMPSFYTRHSCNETHDRTFVVQPIARSYDISCNLSLNLTTLAFNRATLAFNRATLAYRRKTHRLILTSVSHNGRYLAQCIVRASYERFFLCDNSCDQE